MWSDPDIPGLVFRPVSEADDPLIFDIIKATMADYVRKLYGAWDDAEQRRIIKENTDYGAMRILVVDGRDIGILTCLDQGDHLKISQIFVLPKYQRHRLGSIILRDLKGQAARNNLPLRLSVLATNPAAERFYLQHGFVVTEMQVSRTLLEFMPVASPTPAA